MLILDTDHLTALDRQGSAGLLRVRLSLSGERVTTTIVSVAEQMRGLQALLSKARTPTQIQFAYAKIEKWLEDIRHFDHLSWSAQVDVIVSQHRRSKVRIGTMDLRIASIALANDATLLSRNLRDFRRVPGLKVENWLDP